MKRPVPRLGRRVIATGLRRHLAQRQQGRAGPRLRHHARAAVGLVALARPVVEIEAEKGQADAHGLHGRRRAPEPDDGHDDDEHTLDETRNRVRHRGDHGQ